MLGNKGKYKKVVLEPGAYPGRLVQIIDLGLQPQRPFQGQDKPPAYEIMLTYELSDAFMQDEEGVELKDKPRWFSETLPLHSLDAEKAKSTLRYNVLDPTREYNGDFTKLIGSPVMVVLIVQEIKNGPNAGKDGEFVSGIAAMRQKDKDTLPPLVNPSRVFDLDNPDLEVFKSLPEWVQEKIKTNLNFVGSKLDAALNSIPM